MKEMQLILSALLTLTLTGCSTTQEVAYWTDSSYKSALDYDAEQKKALENEISSVHDAIQDIVGNNMGDLQAGTNVDTTPNEPDDATGSLVNADLDTCIAYFRKFITKNSATYKDKYLDVEQNCDLGIVATGAGSPVIEHNGKKYINIVTVSSLTTLSDEDYYNYMVSPISATLGGIVDGTITMTYSDFKAAFEYETATLFEQFEISN